MSAPRDYILFLQDILTEARYAQQFLHGVTVEQLSENPEKERAVLRSLEIIGEAARNIPESVRKKYPQVEWRKMTGTRDRLIHGYRTVEMQRVWDTVQEDLPVLQSQIEQILAELGSVGD